MKTNLNERFTKKTVSNGTVYNINDPIIIQTPRVEIKSIDPRFDEIVLELLPTRATEKFFSKIYEFEKELKEIFSKQTIKPLFDRSTFKIKTTNKNFKVYFANKPFNIYDLRPGDYIIALVSINLLWENLYHDISYSLRVDEILLINKNLKEI